MTENKNKVLVVRVTTKETESIEKTAHKCGLSVSEYLRQRALGYQPRAIPSEEFIYFNDRLNTLCDLCESEVSPETENKLLLLIDEIEKEFISPGKEKRSA